MFRHCDSSSSFAFFYVDSYADRLVSSTQWLRELHVAGIRTNALGGAVVEWVRALACTGDRTVRDGFESHCGQLRFGTLAIQFTPPCQCLSEETLKAVGSFYLVSMPAFFARGSKISHQSALECVTVVDSTTHSKKLPTSRVRLCG